MGMKLQHVCECNPPFRRLSQPNTPNPESTSPRQTPAQTHKSPWRAARKAATPKADWIGLRGLTNSS